MNNNFFSIARYLRCAGYQADVLLGPHEVQHFHPAADSRDLSFQGVVRHVSFGAPLGLSSTPASSIRAALAGYDVIFACGTAPAYLAKAGLRADVFVPYGGDLVDMTRWQLHYPHKAWRMFDFVRQQRRGIGMARVLQMSRVARPADAQAAGDGQWVNEVAIARFAPRAERWTVNLPMVFHPQYDILLDHLLARSHWGHVFDDLRRRHALVVVNHNRILFSDPGDHNSKGTDILLRGWQAFRKAHPKVTAALVCVEYGRDVARGKALSSELGIADAVVWLPQMLRKDLMPLLMQADVVCGQFAHSAMACGTIFEALVAGRPVLGKRTDTWYDDYVLYPMLKADTPALVAARLEEVVSHPEKAREMGREGRRWYEEEVVGRAIGLYERLIQSKVSRTQ
jgi:glycosyltransferase involved in cell wall biosynthesis